MSRRIVARRVPGPVGALLCAALLGAGPGPTAAAGIRAGVARADITPPVGGPTAGYRSAEPSDGVHDPISARVLVLESDRSTIAIAACDLCIFSSPDLVSAAHGGYGASDTTHAEVGAGERLLNAGLAGLFTLQGRLKDEPRRHLFDDK